MVFQSELFVGGPHFAIACGLDKPKDLIRIDVLGRAFGELIHLGNEVVIVRCEILFYPSWGACNFPGW